MDTNHVRVLDTFIHKDLMMSFQVPGYGTLALKRAQILVNKWLTRPLMPYSLYIMCDMWCNNAFLIQQEVTGSNDDQGPGLINTIYIKACKWVVHNCKCIKCSLWRSAAVNAAPACCQPPQPTAESVPCKSRIYCSDFVYALSFSKLVKSSEAPLKTLYGRYL